VLVNGQHYRTIWLDEENPTSVNIIDQRQLPFAFVVERLRTVEDTARAIAEMHVRGAGLIGATAAFGMYLAAVQAPRDASGFCAALQQAAAALQQTRPTAVNLSWAVERVLQRLRTPQREREEATGKGEKAQGGRLKAQGAEGEAQGAELAVYSAIENQDTAFLIAVAKAEAQLIAAEDARWCRQIGEHGLSIIESIAARKKGEPVRILTHCNAGWLAFVDYGTATAPIYAAKRKGIPLHVWVDETRPWNQGARLTAWELLHEGIDHSIITDNSGGHLMQRGRVDLVLVGSDRTTAAGDVANKIGTYLKALAARDNGIPFYVALPSSTIDWGIRDGLRDIPIEERSPGEVKQVRGWSGSGWTEVAIAPPASPAHNPVFDVTPARLVTGLITERGVSPASEAGLRKLFAEKFEPVTQEAKP
jgi:methylthioribose-1-phosphate isomerase